MFIPYFLFFITFDLSYFIISLNVLFCIDFVQHYEVKLVLFVNKYMNKIHVCFSSNIIS